MGKQVKSKQRVADHGEVFTAEREVKAMCDLVKYETEQISATFLEPACGDGNFLAEILSRKLQCNQMKKYRKSPYDWERNSLLVLGSLYGVDILLDNCIACRERLFDIWNKEYKKVCKKECNDDTRRAAQFILSLNIVCGDALQYHLVDENGEITNEPIIFSEWSFVSTLGSGAGSPLLKRKDFSFEQAVNGKPKKKKKDLQQCSLFAEPESEEKDESEFIKEYICHYRRLGDEDAI